MVKFFSAASASELETAINTFLSTTYEVVSSNYQIIDGWHTALIGYKAVATTAAAGGES